MGDREGRGGMGNGSGNEQASRKLLRQVIRQVHPDRFGRYPAQRAQNADSLKRLNSYVDAVRDKGKVSRILLQFFVQRGKDLEPVSVELSRSGSLSPLFRAFGLDSPTSEVGKEDVTLLNWLADTVRDAVRTAEEHNILKHAIREKTESIRARFELGSVGLAVSEFAISTTEQRKQLSALEELEEALSSLGPGKVWKLSTLHMVIYQNASRECESCHVASDGALKVIVNDRVDLISFFETVDTKRAQACKRVATYWRRRAEVVAPRLAEVMRVKSVMGEHEWTGDVQGARDFALFAGGMLESHEKFDECLGDRKFSYSVLVHNDQESSPVEYTDRSCIVQIRNDSNADDVLSFQTSSRSDQVESQVLSERTSREREAELLDQVREALSAKNVISLCSPREHEEVLGAARRLIAAAPQIRSAVDLTGASICIDDCYDAWDNGFVSLPYDFNVGEIAPTLIRLLGNSNSSTAFKRDKIHRDTATAAMSGPTRRRNPRLSSVRLMRPHFRNRRLVSLH